MPPPPWKKARLSRMMSDHLNSPTHGGSLVVETGFPTSLVDLFVKNRHRMKKSSSKKNNWTTEIESEPADSSNFLGEVFETESISSSSSPRRNESIDQEITGESAGARGYFWSWWWWIFKVFFVVVMAMGTKQLAVGITVSAFSLLVMELFGKYISKPWQSKRKFIKNSNHSSSDESQSKEVQIDEHNRNAEVADSDLDLDSKVNETPNPKPNNHLRLPSGEIRVMKSILSSPRFHRRSASDDMGTTKDLHAFKSFNWSWFSEEEMKEGVKKEDADKDTDKDNHSELDQNQISKPLDHDHDCVTNQIVHKSNSRKIKSKIKKFVKKLKSSKKERTDRRNDASCSVSAEESESITASNNLNENNHQPITDSAKSILTENLQVTEKEDNLGLEINNDAKIVEAKRKGWRRRKSTYCVAMLAVILAGLVGGRFCGIAFTLIWCAAMKLIGSHKEGSVSG
ncbi:uncharacterized protein LOC124942015 [Impatiens glandulifera]|uniref:uncharacterized protein LOC124942015 n=1 Tax=Impatiens glandulifera TaxID=253017 RepID=UPI001FB0F3F2|nr:uncharacterized protein LOC124942015 [Impatiens glandulifera]